MKKWNQKKNCKYSLSPTFKWMAKESEKNKIDFAKPFDF